MFILVVCSGLAFGAADGQAGSLSESHLADFSSAQATNEASVELDASAKPSDSEVVKRNWLDKSQAYAAHSTDSLSNWIDHFFGEPRSDLESAHTALRMSLENEWEGGDRDTNVRLRGKVYLPRINERLSLIFTDNEQEQNSTAGGDINQLSGTNENTQVALQYNVKDEKRSRLDLNVGLRSSLQGKVTLRYRKEVAADTDLAHRFTESLYYFGGEGLGLRSKYELEKTLDENHLLRWDNTVKFSEGTEGVAWHTKVLFGQRLSEKSAISYFTWSNGETRPEYLTNSYGLGVSYRRNFYRPWLFYELEPRYAWEREELSDKRAGVAFFIIRLEISLESLR